MQTKKAKSLSRRGSFFGSKSSPERNGTNGFANEELKMEEELSEPRRQEMDPTQSEEIQRMAEIYRLISEVKESGMKIDIPIFVLVGAQSAGKSTVVNRILRFPASFAQDGTGTRCPTMYIVEQSKDRNANIVVDFENERLGSWHELHGRVRSHMEKLKRGNTFSSDPIRVRVQSPHVSNFVIVDLPGLIRTDNDERYAIDQMVRKFLLETLPTNTYSTTEEEIPYKAIPIVIRSCAVIEEDDTFDRIDRLIGDARPGWKDEPTTLVVCNKFDERSNYGSAEDFYDAIEKLRDACGALDPIFTCLRPPTSDGRVPAGHELQANPRRHLEYLQSVPQLETDWFETKFAEYCRLTGNERLQRDLYSCQRNQCTSKVLIQKYTLSMQKIVQGSASRVVRSLDMHEKDLTSEMGRLNTALHNSEPSKFRQLKEVLLTKFLQHIITLRKKGKPAIADFCKMSYDEEYRRLCDHLVYTQDQAFLNFFEYFKLEPEDLKKLYHTEEHENEEKDLEVELAGVAQFERSFTAWKAMVACMTSEKLEWAQKRNMKGGHDSALHGDFQDQMRNILAHMLEQMQYAVRFLGESLRMHFHHMADKVAEYIAQTEYAAFLEDDEKLTEDDDEEEGESSEHIPVQFLYSIRDDYKSVIDRLIDRFILTYAEDSKLECVDTELPAFIMMLVHKIEHAYNSYRMQVEKYSRDKSEALRNGSGTPTHVEPPQISIPIDGRNADDSDPGSDDEKIEVEVPATEVDDDNDDDIGQTVRNVVGDAADDLISTALPGIGNFLGNKVKGLISGGFQNVLKVWKTISKTIRLNGEVRYVDLFNACMQKEPLFNLMDNEDQASACAAIHRQIYLFVLIHNVKQRVFRLVDVVNQTDSEGYISHTMRNGLAQSDIERAVHQLEYSHDFGDDGIKKLRDFLAQFERPGERMVSLSDEEIQNRFANGRKKLQDKWNALKKERKEFLKRKGEIVKKLKEAGLLSRGMPRAVSVF